VSPRVKPKRTADDVLDLAANRLARGELAEARLERLLLQGDRGRSELAEFRSRVVSGERTHAASPDEVWWKYLLAPAVPSPLGGSVYGLDQDEHRVLSKASSAAGGYLVPTSLDDQITAARRARAVIGALAREVITGDGTTMLFPSTTTHGVATWTAENASYTASDEVFGQVSVGAFKSSTKVIVSEELARDALADFEAYLADSWACGSRRSRRPRLPSATVPGNRWGSSTRRAPTRSQPSPSARQCSTRAPTFRRSTKP
jgi:HK97 family phage major capsid protein